MPRQVHDAADKSDDNSLGKGSYDVTARVKDAIASYLRLQGHTEEHPLLELPLKLSPQGEMNISVNVANVEARVEKAKTMAGRGPEASMGKGSTSARTFKGFFNMLGM